MKEYILEDIHSNIIFTKRAVPLPLGARLSYRAAQICLILGQCCAPREPCSLRKIQTISNAMFQFEEFEKLVYYSKHPSAISDFVPRIDPCVNMTIEFLLKYGLCKQNKTNRDYKLTLLGRKYLNAIIGDDIMQKEKAMLGRLGISLTEEMIDYLIK